MKISLLPPFEKEKGENNFLNHPHPAPPPSRRRGEKEGERKRLSFRQGVLILGWKIICFAGICQIEKEGRQGEKGVGSEGTWVSE
jgi:hypothetical protein